MLYTLYNYYNPFRNQVVSCFHKQFTIHKPSPTQHIKYMYQTVEVSYHTVYLETKTLGAWPLTTVDIMCSSVARS